LIDHINLRLAKGDKIGVLGDNGVGKSTLMQAIVNDKFLSANRIYRADGISINYFDQKVENLDLTKTPFQYLGDGEDFVHFKDGRSLHVNAYFEKFLFDKSEVQRPLSSFSGGELKRLQLALNLKNESDVWIFDEPTNDLDIESIEILEDALATFKGTVIIISHDRTFLENITNKIWFIHDKKIEKFEAGYSQVQDYLDLIAIEKSYGAEEESDSKLRPSDAPPKEKKKLSNKDKELLKKLPKLIQEKEKEIITLEEKLAKIDYSNLDEKTSLELNELTQSKEHAEEKLLEYYEKQEELDA
jgi:ATP-binding cassette subfamily F protein uup